MLPLQTWYEAAAGEPLPTAIPRRSRPRWSITGIRRALGQRLVDLGKALAGDAPVSTTAAR